MPVSYTPFSAADYPIDAAKINLRMQSIEDYFVALVAGGSNTQTPVVAEAGEGLGDRNPGYLDLNDGKIYKMDADAAGPKAGIIRGFVDGTRITGADATLVIGGMMDGFSSLTPFATVFVSTTSGTITQTRPSPVLDSSQVMIAEMGFAISADTIFVQPRPIQFHKRVAASDNETVTVQHYSDERGFRRNLWAYITENEAGATLATYSSANQDSDVALEGQAPAAYTADLCTGGTALGNLTESSGLAGAFDNDSATPAVRTATNGIIGYDFGSGVTKAIRRVTWQIGTGTTNSPNDFTVQYSDDNSSWTTTTTVTNETGWSSMEKRTYDCMAGGSHRYWRINVSDNNGGTQVAAREVEMMEAATFVEYDKLTQTLPLASTSTVAGVSLYLKKVGSPTGTVTVRIETVSGGNPTGTLADANASVTFSESALTTSYALTSLNFASSFSLAAGDYAIVLSTSRAASATDYIVLGADGSSPSFAGGEMKTYSSGAWSAASKDAIFTLSGPGLTHPSRVSVDWWSSTHADMVNRYGDGSGDDEATKTTFKCLRDAGFDDITVVVELQ